MTPSRPRLAIFKFASCDGCQLQLIDLLEEAALLRGLADGVEIAHFTEAGPEAPEGPFDIALVEGSICTAADRVRVREVRAKTRFLLTIGACATSGGIQALRNWMNFPDVLSAVYARPEYVESLRDSTAIGDHVHVDFELRGCPINKEQLRDVLSAFLLGRRPHVPGYSVCVECKRRGSVCVTVARGEPCLGPVTQAGCGAICPAFDRGCYGCFGASDQPNTPAQVNLMKAMGVRGEKLGHAFRSFAHSMEFERAAEEALSAPAAGGTGT